MTISLGPLLCKLLCAAVAVWPLTGLASAQPPDAMPDDSALASVRAVVPMGATIYVTDASHGVIKGTLAAINKDALVVAVKEGTRSVSASDLRRIEWRRPDSRLNGALIGEGVSEILSRAGDQSLASGAGFMIRPIAFTSCAQRDSSRSSCFLPSGVRR